MTEKLTSFPQTESNMLLSQSVVSGIDLSVIIPAYNLEKSIADCMDSVLRQNVEKMEIIVVDDGSKDSTGAIIKKYAEKYKQIVPILYTKNRGVSAARNAGLDVACGKYIHFCDGDDSVPAGAYEELLHIAEEEKPDLVTGNYSRMYPNENGAIRPFSHYTAPTGKERCFESGNTTLWNKMFRRSLIEKEHLRFDTELKCMEDLLFYNRFLLAASKISYTDKFVYTYTEPIVRASDGNIRFANMDCVIGLAKTWKDLFSHDLKNDSLLWWQAYQHNISWYFNYSWRMIQDPIIRREAFVILHSLIIWVEKREIKNCSWLSVDHKQTFIDIFHIDYHTFCVIPYEDYLFQMALYDNIQARPADSMALKEIECIQYIERDKYLIQNTKKQLEEIKELWEKERINKRLWKQHYWALIDSMMNDYWFQIDEYEVKEALFYEIREYVELMRTQNPLCGFSLPDDVWRFRQIFCVDNATLQVITFPQYLVSRTPKGITSSGGWTAPAPETIGAFIGACQRGQVGMKSILSAAKAWTIYKLNRGKK